MPKNYYIPDPSIKRLAYVAGVKELSSLTYEEMRGVIRNWLDPILLETMIYAANKGKKTLNESMIAASLPQKMWSNNPLENSCKVYKSKAKAKSKSKEKVIDEVVELDITQSPEFSPVASSKSSSKSSSRSSSKLSSKSSSQSSSQSSFPGLQPPSELFVPTLEDGTSVDVPKKKRSKRRSRRGDKTIREMRYYQQNSGCLNIPIETFSRVAREIATDLSIISDFRFSKNGLLLLQYATESYVVELFKAANFIVLHANRIKLMPKDIALAIRLRE